MSVVHEVWVGSVRTPVDFFSLEEVLVSKHCGNSGTKIFQCTSWLVDWLVAGPVNLVCNGE